ncbi:hypothetical protein [uncultured Selenomonas sp.]|uniref:hypothetical protein n=1 Tax=uncultured Selenomonas sp. TaxID=159275 RepID=UPI0026257EBD|nr:hypothetical protein [uncultured Selenomonas sp.]
MKTTNFTTTLTTGEVLKGTVEHDVNYWTYAPYDYARIELVGKHTALHFSRDLFCDNEVSEDLYVERLDEQGRVIARDLIDVSGGKAHCVDLDAAGEYGEIVRRALAAVEAAA